MQRRHFLKLSTLGLTAMAFPRFVLGKTLTLPAQLAENPLLQFNTLPAFQQIKANHIKPAVDFLLAECRKLTEQLAQQPNINWQDFYLPLADINDKLSHCWGIVEHLNQVRSSNEWRDAYDISQKDITDYYIWSGQHSALYQAFVKLQQQPEYANYSDAQRQTITNVLLDFRLSGIGLSKTDQTRYTQIQQRLSELSTQYGNNVLDATNGWEKFIEDPTQLAGLSEQALTNAKQSAENKQQKGYRLSLDYPSFSAVMMYCENRALREEIYRAYMTRASDQSPQMNKWNNGPIIDEILALRAELAHLLGFKTYADYSLATKMAENPQQVIDFLNDLNEKSHHQAQREIQELTEYAQKQGINELKPWDIMFYSEKLKNEHYAINQEELRVYFPMDKVLSGLFDIAHRLYNISIKEKQNVEVWDEQVRFFEVFNDKNEHISSFYLDPYVRENKRGGAWMNGIFPRKVSADGELSKPVAIIVCNFNSPLKDQPSLLLHQNTVTLFHEFGHSLHHMLTEIDISAVSGINGVAWDAVEFPSQLMENFCWQENSLKLISSHIKTGEPLPKQQLTQILAAKNFQSAYLLGRQIIYALCDFRLNLEYKPNEPHFVQQIYQDVQQKVAVIQSPEWVRVLNCFNHIFSGGYAAGYYGYLWSEVLAADGFDRFAQQGVLSREIGLAFIESFLSKGGSKPAMQLYKHFRGREPDPTALLKNKGIL